MKGLVKEGERVGWLGGWVGRVGVCQIGGKERQGGTRQGSVSARFPGDDRDKARVWVVEMVLRWR